MATSFSRPLANRAVHLRITPRPSNLGESREMMRLLSQFGEIEYFKNLKYDALSAPTSALVIYKEESAARECLRRSPIRFRMGRVAARHAEEDGGGPEMGDEVQDALSPYLSGSSAEGRQPRGPLGTPFGLTPPQQSRFLSTTSLPTPPPNPIRPPFSNPPTPDDNLTPPSRLFQIQTNTTHRRFRDHINTGHYHGAFAIDSKMPGQQDLAKKVPLLGLSCVDWRAGDRLWRLVEKERVRLGGVRLGSLWGGDGRGEEVKGRGSEVEEFGVGVGLDDVGESTVKGGEFKPFGVDTEKGRGNESAGDDGGTLGDFMKGWEKVVSDFAPGGRPLERYSRKPR